MINKIESLLSPAGFSVEITEYTDENGKLKQNLIAKLGEGTGGLAFCSHTDTVPAAEDAFDPHEDGKKLYGRGTCDMKGPLAATLVAVLSVDPSRLKKPITIIATADEELGLIGASYMVKDSKMLEEWSPEYGVIAEPTEMMPVYSHKGMGMVHVTAIGRAAHSSTGFGESANLLIAPFLAEIAQLDEMLQRDHSYMNDEYEPSHHTLNLTLRDESAFNVTSPETSAIITVRTMPDSRSEEVLDMIVSRAQSHGFDVDMRYREALVTPQESELVTAAVEITGIDPQTVTYGTDGVFLQEHIDQLVVLGPGDIALAHTDKEYVPIPQLYEAVDVYTQLIERLCMGGEGSPKTISPLQTPHAHVQTYVQTPNESQRNQSMERDMLDRAEEIKEKIVGWRRTIHQNPELSFEEVKTAGLVASTLSDLGIEYQTGVGKTGVVARIGNGNGRTIGIRADMDALPIHEQTDVPFKSQIDGKMHACGHDAHTAMLLGVATLLKEKQIDGEVRLLFQPSEEAADAEGVSGAPRMIEDGAIEGLDAVISLHTDSTTDAGKITIADGYVLANVDTVFATIIGKGGHGAMPHEARDPIFMLAPILTALHGIVSRWIDPTQPAVVTVGKVSGGTVSNVIPNSVDLEITVRSTDDDVRKQLLVEIENALTIARMLGGDYEMKTVHGYPALYNDPEVTGWMRSIATEMIGTDNVVAGKLMMGAEDFAYMSRASKGAMFMLGGKYPDGDATYHHHPKFDLDESSFPIGTAILAETALRFVRGELD